MVKSVMVKFVKYRFCEPEDEIIDYMKTLNSFEIICIRYKGMGWYDILVESNDMYKIISMGGENGYTARDNETTYKQLTNTEFITMSDLIISLEDTNNLEIN